MSFHNTIHVTQAELPLFQDKAKRQEDVILEIFTERKGDWLNPDHVHTIYKARTGKNTPITSIRRAISDLSKGNDAKLIKSALAVSRGLYGVPTHSWTLA